MRTSASTAVLLAATLFAFAATCNAADFSGKYVSRDHGRDTSLEVVQNESAIVFTRIEGGKTTKGVCPLGGSEGEYVSSSGVPGKCKAQFKGKDLVIEVTVVAHPAASAQSMRVQTIERWRLSSDVKTLTIKSKANFPDADPAIASAIADDFSYTERFARTEVQ